MKKDWLKLKEKRCPICGHEINQSGKSDYNCLRCGFYCRYAVAQKVILDVEYNQEVKEHDKQADDWLAKNS